MTMLAEMAGPGPLLVERMLGAARSRAEALGIRVAIALVDGAGNLAGFLRMPGAFLSSSDLAIDKAYTAASFAMSTRDFGGLLEQAPPAVRDGLLRRPRLTAVPGGLSLLIEGRAAGAIGVSGGTDVEDEDVAASALALLTQASNSGRE